MRSIAVTGATSMIGTALIKEAIKENIRVVAFVRKGSHNISRLPVSELIRVIECDLDGFGAFETDEKCDVFYHFAWGSTDRAGRNDPTVQEKNIACTLDAVKLAHKMGCKKFIGAGSQAEYGYVDGMIDDMTVPDPVSCYGIAKYASCKLSKVLCSELGITHIWTRIFSVFGTNDGSGTMLSYAVRQFRNGEKAEFSAGTQMWNYLFESDAGKIFLRIGQMVSEDKIYRISSDVSKPLREYITEMAEVFGEGFSYSFAEKNSEGVYGIYPETETLFRDIDLRPQVSFSEGVRKLLDLW